MCARFNRGWKNDLVRISMMRQIINGRISTGDPCHERHCQTGNYYNESRSVKRLEG
jgi:hypothetical protein